MKNVWVLGKNGVVGNWIFIIIEFVFINIDMFVINSIVLLKI